MSEEAQEEPALTEAVVVQTTFLTGLAVEIADDFVRVIGWEQLPDLGGEMRERRIALRAVMPKATAHHLLGLLRRGLRGRYEH